jgi:hypothetical protein
LDSLLFRARLRAWQSPRQVTLCLGQTLHVERHRLDHPLHARETIIRIVVATRLERVPLGLYATKCPRAEKGTGESDSAEKQAEQRYQCAWITHEATVWQRGP